MRRVGAVDLENSARRIVRAAAHAGVDEEDEAVELLEDAIGLSLCAVGEMDLSGLMALDEVVRAELPDEARQVHRGPSIDKPELAFPPRGRMHARLEDRG